VVELAIKEGDAVVYGKTGTTGRVLRITELEGKAWAELDSTELLYDLNVLEPVDETKLKRVLRKGKRQEKEAPGGGREGEGEGEEKAPRVEDMKDEGSLDASAGICGAG